MLIIAVAAGLYMAWNIGANDVANAMGTSVGSRALTLRGAVVLAAIFEFSGALFVGSHVTDTIRKGIVDVDRLRAAVESREGPPPAPAASAPATAPALSAPHAGWSDRHLREELMIGMLAAILGAAAWINIATFFAQPVSTTHAIVGSVIGFAVVSAGPGAVFWGAVGRIAASWVVSPVAGLIMAFLIYKAVQKLVLSSRHPVFMARRAVPLTVGLVGFILGLSIFYDLFRMRGGGIWLALPAAAAAGAAAGWIAQVILGRTMARKRVRLKDRYIVVERWFGRIQIATACYMAFAHGANDVANAIGPLAAVVHFAGGGKIAGSAPVPLWLLALGGVGIVVGLGTYGYKVIRAIGEKITEITPTRGFAAQFSTASTVLVCSLMGLPISTTFVLVGAVMGVGLARGFGALDLKVIRRIFASWVVTIPVSAGLAGVFYHVLAAVL